MEIDNRLLISIIVPVYNVENFLDYCISSIMKQTYTNFELILIDDNSKDSSGDLCDKWYKKDSRIRVVHHDRNKGLAAARNSGLDIAKGDLICFVDSDDFVTENYLETFMIGMSKTSADMILCDVASAKLGEADSPLDKVLVMNSHDCRNWLMNPLSKEYVLMVVSWNKMYKRRIFDNLRFEQGKYHEDEFMINHILQRIEKVTFVPLKNYVYRNNESSITGKNNITNVAHIHVIEAYVQRIDIALEEDSEEGNAFAANTFKWALLKLAQFYKNGDSKMKYAAKAKYDQIFDEYSELLTDKQKVKYKMFTVTPGVFCKTFLRD